MTKGNKKLFLDKTKLWEMLHLRLNGYAIRTLASLYNCHHTSIIHQCEKYGIKPLKHDVYRIERIAGQVISKAVGNYKIVNGEHINLGKSYKEYLVDAKYPPKFR